MLSARLSSRKRTHSAHVERLAANIISVLIFLFLFIYFNISDRGFPVLSGSLALQHLGPALPFFCATQVFNAPHCLLQRLFGRLREEKFVLKIERDENKKYL